MYDIELLLKELDILDQEKEDLKKEVREEIPKDEMLFELHLFRAVTYLKKLKSKN